ncbi:CIPK11 [Symbiodinium natans]|uniref:CIPK11 protein n=1 Tax=Symbiodinium natans TaxID=878477 RepID=A0A812SKM5_9DINO|nr:CIPK11 [Symbiodinium natans]
MIRRRCGWQQHIEAAAGNRHWGGALGIQEGRFCEGDAAPPPPPPPKLNSLEETPEEEEEEKPVSGLDRVHKYMKLLLPAAPTEGPTSWEAALMEEAPTLLPTLKFHNLVYGAEDIGQGAFSVVRYARAIQQEKTQSQWPEYAVKVINTKTMEELGYEASVNREICVLKMLSHPGIARMVAAFRYRDGAYLVLEYAHKGDLHNILVGAGKLEEEVVRFLVGEVVAALCAIHDIGDRAVFKLKSLYCMSYVRGDVQSFCEPFVSFVWDWASLETHSDSIGTFLREAMGRFRGLVHLAAAWQTGVTGVTRCQWFVETPWAVGKAMNSGHPSTHLTVIGAVTRPRVCDATIFSQIPMDRRPPCKPDPPSRGDLDDGGYDPDPANVVNFFKIAAIPGCGAADGLNIPSSVTTSVLLPAELPACEHCVLRWEWTGHQQVVNIEFYVQCADIQIASSAPPVLPSPVTAIAGIEHLPSGADSYRKVYNGQGPDEQYLVGPAVATYSSCDVSTAGCLGLGVVPISSTSPSAATSTTSATSAAGSGCTCTSSTEWIGDFDQFASGTSFCSQNFGGANPWISAGGGDGSSGGFSGAGPCTSGQYSFQDGSWQILAGQEAKGVMPYRAFAYAQFCNGKAYSECWTTGEATFSFSLMVSGVSQTGAFVKVLFWTDAGNILGLVPPSHPKGEGKLRLVAFMSDDYPNSWDFELDVVESTWYHIQVSFQASTGGAEVAVNGAVMGSGTLPVNMLAATNGPQIGIYSFDYGTSWPTDGLTLSLADACIGTVAGTCRSGVVASSPTETSTASVAALSTTAAGTPGSSGTAPPQSAGSAGTTSSPGESGGIVSGDSCPLEGFGLPSFVSQCYCGFVGQGGAGCGPDDGTACWCKCCCHHRTGSCRYRMVEEEEENSSDAGGAILSVLLSAGTCLMAFLA